MKRERPEDMRSPARPAAPAQRRNAEDAAELIRMRRENEDLKKAMRASEIAAQQAAYASFQPPQAAGPALLFGSQGDPMVLEPPVTQPLAPAALPAVKVRPPSYRDYADGRFRIPDRSSALWPHYVRVTGDALQSQLNDLHMRATHIDRTMRMQMTRSLFQQAQTIGVNLIIPQSVGGNEGFFGQFGPPIGEDAPILPPPAPFPAAGQGFPAGLGFSVEADMPYEDLTASESYRPSAYSSQQAYDPSYAAAAPPQGGAQRPLAAYAAAAQPRGGAQRPPAFYAAAPEPRAPAAQGGFAGGGAAYAPRAPMMQGAYASGAAAYDPQALANYGAPAPAAFDLRSSLSFGQPSAFGQPAAAAYSQSGAAAYSQSGAAAYDPHAAAAPRASVGTAQRTLQRSVAGQPRAPTGAAAQSAAGHGFGATALSAVPRLPLSASGGSPQPFQALATHEGTTPGFGADIRQSPPNRSARLVHSEQGPPIGEDSDSEEDSSPFLATDSPLEDSLMDLDPPPAEITSVCVRAMRAAPRSNAVQYRSGGIVLSCEPYVHGSEILPDAFVRTFIGWAERSGLPNSRWASTFIHLCQDLDFRDELSNVPPPVIGAATIEEVQSHFAEMVRLFLGRYALTSAELRVHSQKFLEITKGATEDPQDFCARFKKGFTRSHPNESIHQHVWVDLFIHALDSDVQRRARNWRFYEDRAASLLADREVNEQPICSWEQLCSVTRAAYEHRSPADIADAQRRGIHAYSMQQSSKRAFVEAYAATSASTRHSTQDAQMAAQDRPFQPYTTPAPSAEAMATHRISQSPAAGNAGGQTPTYTSTGIPQFKFKMPTREQREQRDTQKRVRATQLVEEPGPAKRAKSAPRASIAAAGGGQSGGYAAAAGPPAAGRSPPAGRSPARPDRPPPTGRGPCPDCAMQHDWPDCVRNDKSPRQNPEAFKYRDSGPHFRSSEEDRATVIRLYGRIGVPLGQNPKRITASVRHIGLGSPNHPRPRSPNPQSLPDPPAEVTQAYPLCPGIAETLLAFTTRWSAAAHEAFPGRPDDIDEATDRWHRRAELVHQRVYNSYYDCSASQLDHMARLMVRSRPKDAYSHLHSDSAVGNPPVGFTSRRARAHGMDFRADNIVARHALKGTSPTPEEVARHPLRYIAPDNIDLTARLAFEAATNFRREDALASAHARSHVRLIRRGAGGSSEILVKGTVGGIPIKDMLADTGSHISLLALPFYELHAATYGPLLPAPSYAVTVADGSPATILGTLRLPVTIIDSARRLAFTRVCSFCVINSLNVDVLAGMDLLMRFFHTIGLQDGRCSFRQNIRADSNQSLGPAPSTLSALRLSAPVIIPPQTIRNVTVYYQSDFHELEGAPVYIEPIELHNAAGNVIAIDFPAHLRGGAEQMEAVGTYSLAVRNLSSRSLNLPAGLQIGNATLTTENAGRQRLVGGDPPGPRPLAPEPRRVAAISASNGKAAPRPSEHIEQLHVVRRRAIRECGQGCVDGQEADWAAIQLADAELDLIRTEEHYNSFEVSLEDVTRSDQRSALHQAYHNKYGIPAYRALRDLDKYAGEPREHPGIPLGGLCEFQLEEVVEARDDICKSPLAAADETWVEEMFRLHATLYAAQAAWDSRPHTPHDLEDEAEYSRLLTLRGQFDAEYAVLSDSGLHNDPLRGTTRLAGATKGALLRARTYTHLPYLCIPRAYTFGIRSAAEAHFMLQSAVASMAHVGLQSTSEDVRRSDTEDAILAASCYSKNHPLGWVAVPWSAWPSGESTWLPRTDPRVIEFGYSLLERTVLAFNNRFHAERL